MNANTIITDDMTLDEKLAAIDAAIANALEAAEQVETSSTDVDAPVDPADLTMCVGCQ